MRAYRLIFFSAAIYNLAFGLWTILFPQQFFDIFGLQRLPYPALWSCLGMVVGLYGILYAWAAQHLEQGDWIIAVGLLGKVLGPLGWLDAVRRGELPSQTFPLILCNDLIWYFPFLFYLLRHREDRSRWIVGMVVLFHALACLGLVFLAPGMDFNPDFQGRWEFIRANSFWWVLVWVLWVLSSLSFAAFAACWIEALRRRGVSPLLWWLLGLAILAILFDFSGELVYIVWLPNYPRGLEEFQWGTRFYNIASAAIANGIYCLVGLLLSLVSGRKRFFRPWVASWGYLAWIVGFGLTAAALLQLRWPTMITAAATMALFLPWAAWVGWRYLWQRSSS